MTKPERYVPKAKSNNRQIPCEDDLISENSYTQAKRHDSSNTSEGVQYNYAAATIKTMTEANNKTTATRDIYSARWKPPLYSVLNDILSYKPYLQPSSGGC